MIDWKKTEVVRVSDVEKIQKILWIWAPDLRTTFTCGYVDCETCNRSNEIQSEFNKKFEEIKTLENERNETDAQTNIAEWVQKKEELEKKKEELPIWLKEQLKPLEEKKQKTLEIFRKVGINVDNMFDNYFDIVTNGVCNFYDRRLKIEDYMNLYKEWKLENLKALSDIVQHCHIIDEGELHNLRTLLENYDGINSLNKNNIDTLFYKAPRWLNVPLSQLESLNKVNISEERLKQLEDLRAFWENIETKKGSSKEIILTIEDPQILDASYEMPIDLMKQCIESWVVKKNLRQFLSCKSWELKKMIQYNQYLWITFSGDFLKDHREDLRFNLDEFDLNWLKEIRNLFGSFSYFDLDDIKWQQFKDNIKIFKQLTQWEKELCWDRDNTVIGTIVTLNNEFNTRNTEQKQQFIDNLKRFGQLKNIWKTWNPKINISDIVALNNLSNEQYQKVIENVKKLQELWIRINFYNNIKFLSDELWEEYMHKFSSRNNCFEGIEIPFYPILRLFHTEWIEFPKDLNSIKYPEFMWKIAALIKPGYNPKGTNPDKLKEFLDIDRDGVQQLKEIWISLDLDFFVEDDRENFEYKKITFKIQVENFKTIYNKWTKDLKKDIQQGCLYPREMKYILYEYYSDQKIEWKTEMKEKFKREVCTEENEKNGLSLEKALEIMDQYVADHSKWKPSQE